MSQPTYLWDPPPVYSLPLRGRKERLPINRLFFVGRNYHAHAVEMGRAGRWTILARSCSTSPGGVDSD